MPKFYINSKKKKKCILLIGGYKDIPYIWNEIEKCFINDKIDYYAPRTAGNGRSFFQVISYKDWIITYLEAIYILQEQYETIDIISFSAGTIIALYLSQFEYKCKIENLFLCAPFLLHNDSFSINLLFSNNIFSKFLNTLYLYTFRFHPKSKEKMFSGYRSTYNDFYSINDYCELFGDIKSENYLFDLYKLRPEKILVDNIIILYSKEDHIIGNIDKQYNIINNIYNKSIHIIKIPSNTNTNKTLNLKCGHVMFKEYSEIIYDIYENIKKFTLKNII
jgi:esterase/lipase